MVHGIPLESPFTIYIQRAIRSITVHMYQDGTIHRWPIVVDSSTDLRKGAYLRLPPLQDDMPGDRLNKQKKITIEKKLCRHRVYTLIRHYIYEFMMRKGR